MYDLAINFRGTLSYVTDPAGTVDCTAGRLYPFSRSGSPNYGWVGTGAGGADRDTAPDPRLAGIGYAAPSESYLFRMDGLAASVATSLYWAVGDHFQQFLQKLQVIDSDGSTVLMDVDHADISADTWWDASGVRRTSSSDWVANNAPATVTPSGTSLYFRLGPTSGYSCIAHFRAVQAVSLTPHNLTLLGCGA